MTKIRKAVFPVLVWNALYLQPRRCRKSLPVIDKPLIQYAAEEAIAAGIDTLIFVTVEISESKITDANNELETMLRAKGKDAQAEMVAISSQREWNAICASGRTAGEGHAVLCASVPLAVIPLQYFWPMIF